MNLRRDLLAFALVLYGLGLAWGYLRLPVAAIKNLADHSVMAEAIHFDTPLGISSAQRWYLDRAYPESPGTLIPRVGVEVKWNALLFARAHSFYYASPTGAEGRDSLFVNVFGAWIALYDFEHVMA